MSLCCSKPTKKTSHLLQFKNLKSYKLPLRPCLTWSSINLLLWPRLPLRVPSTPVTLAFLLFLGYAKPALTSGLLPLPQGSCPCCPSTHNIPPLCSSWLISPLLLVFAGTPQFQEAFSDLILKTLTISLHQKHSLTCSRFLHAIQSLPNVLLFYLLNISLPSTRM